jgi:hypothetical protein
MGRKEGSNNQNTHIRLLHAFFNTVHLGLKLLYENISEYSFKVIIGSLFLEIFQIMHSNSHEPNFAYSIETMLDNIL